MKFKLGTYLTFSSPGLVNFEPKKTSPAWVRHAGLWNKGEHKMHINNTVHDVTSSRKIHLVYFPTKLGSKLLGTRPKIVPKPFSAISAAERTDSSPAQSSFSPTYVCGGTGQPTIITFAFGTCDRRAVTHRFNVALRNWPAQWSSTGRMYKQRKLVYD